VPHLPESASWGEMAVVAGLGEVRRFSWRDTVRYTSTQCTGRAGQGAGTRSHLPRSGLAGDAAWRAMQISRSPGAADRASGSQPV